MLSAPFPPKEGKLVWKFAFHLAPKERSRGLTLCFGRTWEEADRLISPHGTHSVFAFWNIFLDYGWHWEKETLKLYP